MIAITRYRPAAALDEDLLAPERCLDCSMLNVFTPAYTDFLDEPQALDEYFLDHGNDHHVAVVMWCRRSRHEAIDWNAIDDEFVAPKCDLQLRHPGADDLPHAHFASLHRSHGDARLFVDNWQNYNRTRLDATTHGSPPALTNDLGGRLTVATLIAFPLFDRCSRNENASETVRS
jgi:hypothetical protein